MSTLLDHLTKVADSEIKRERRRYDRVRRGCGSALSRSVSGGIDGEPLLLSRYRENTSRSSYYKLSRDPGTSDSRYHG